MARTHPPERATRFGPLGAWRTPLRPKREHRTAFRPIYLIGFLALVSFVVVLSCSV